MQRNLKLEELAARAGVSARTVRYYIQRGLLPAPEFRGPDTSYDEQHLVALKAIRRLQDAFLPLDAIASALHGKSIDELRALGRAPDAQDERDPRRAEPLATRGELEVQSTAQRGTRHELARGLELWVADDASASVQELASALRALATQRTSRRGGDKA